MKRHAEAHRNSRTRTTRTLATAAAMLVVLLTGGGPTADRALAQTTPQAIKVQGYLTDQSGGTPVPANGPHSILFEIFDAPAAGLLVVSVGPLVVDVSDGRYEAELPLSALLFEESERYLELTINGELLSPRIRLVSVPYAFSSARTDSVLPGSIDSDALATGAVTLDKLGVVCADDEVLVYTVGVGWDCAPPQVAGPVCESGSFVSCYTGPPDTLDVGSCRAGQADCVPDQSGFGSCSGDVTPVPEVCDNEVDDDCDGQTDCLDDDCADDPACPPCPDADDDGYADIACGGTDCDDGNDAVNPGALEVCDGVDNDCDPASADGDEDPLNGAACDGTDSDLCVEGTYSCSGGSLVCSDNTGDTVDVCDGVDNDCDPASADGDEDPLNGAACDGTDSDLCAEGILSCSGGSLVCSDNTSSDLDVCDGVDNDCDPASADGDEDPANGVACDGTDSDLCAEGTFSCSGGSLVCSDNTGDTVDVCDGVDNDCDPASADGDEDPLNGAACDGTDSDLCVEGTYSCSAGSLVCSDNTSSDLDVCDGVDNDCDPASADGSEDPLNGVACDGTDSDLCAEGTFSCSAGSLVCSDNTSSDLDVCDGVDNDCDPASADGDEDPLNGAACDGTDSDLCAEGILSCSGGSLVCSDNTSSDLDVCDGVDNDCDPASADGDEDPANGVACDGTDSDLCAEGILSCSAGSLVCSDATGDTLDVCDGFDNDCDPASADGDEDPSNGVACDGTDSDLCVEGTYSCSGGSLICSDNTSSDLDVCDGLDNDCDPASADGSEDPNIGMPCDGPDSDFCNEGTLGCSAGSLVCSDTSGDDHEVCLTGLDEDCDTETDEPDCIGCGGFFAPVECNDVIIWSTIGSTASLDGYSCAVGVPQPGAEVIYEFAASASGSVTVDLTGASANLDLYVLEGACSPVTCIASGNGVSTTDETVTFSAVIGTIYYIVVESTGGESDFELNFQCGG